MTEVKQPFRPPVLAACVSAAGNVVTIVNRVMDRDPDTLVPGGYIVLKDMFLDQHGQDPEKAVFFGLTALFYTREGRSHPVEDARAWLMAAGLEQIHLTVLDGFQFVRGRKPARA